MSHYLALDTCTEICSVGLWSNGVVTSAVSDVPREHTQRLLPMAEALLADAELSASDLDGVFCTRGPGSFTGVRIGISVAQGVSFACNTPVWPLSTLAVLAVQGHRIHADQLVWRVAMDARMGEIYHGLYRVEEGLPPQLLEPEKLLTIDDLASQVDAGEVSAGHAGSGWSLLGQPVPEVEAVLPSPEAVLDCGLRMVRSGVDPVTAMELQPVYLRDNVAQTA